MILRILTFCERLIFGSEKLFKSMILNEIEENSLFVEIGSSDLSESKIVLHKKNKVNIIVFEPDARNINSPGSITEYNIIGQRNLFGRNDKEYSKIEKFVLNKYI